MQELAKDRRSHTNLLPFAFGVAIIALVAYFVGLFSSAITSRTTPDSITPISITINDSGTVSLNESAAYGLGISSPYGFMGTEIGFGGDAIPAMTALNTRNGDVPFMTAFVSTTDEGKRVIGIVTENDTDLVIEVTPPTDP